MKDNYSFSIEAQKLTASTLDEFTEKAKTLMKDGTTISNIVAIVVTTSIP